MARKKSDCTSWAYAILRVTLGLLFIVPGLGKLMNPSGLTGMLSSMGWPAPLLFTWLVLLVEIIFGVMLLLGWKTRIAPWPLFVVLLVATLTVALPGALQSSNWVNTLFHVVGLAGLYTISQTGPGKYALDN